MQKTLATMAFNLFVVGTVLTVFWFLLALPSFYSSFSQRKKTTNLDFNKYANTQSLIAHLTFTNLVTASLVLLGTAILLWIGQITWNDITVWNKSIFMILFGSRTGENISLGIGMKIIDYFLISFTLFISGLLIFIYGRLQKGSAVNIWNSSSSD